MAGPQARASGWAARAAVALARRWPGPRRTVLVDLDVARPSLHGIVGVENEQGVLDVVDFGASLHQIAVPAENERFHLLPAGPFGGAGEVALLEADAWPRILYEAAGRRETLLLYVAAESPGSAALVQRVGAVLVLAEAAETKALVERLPRRYAVLAALEPPRTTMASAARPRPAEAAVTPAAGGGAPIQPVSDDGREALRADLRRRQHAARLRHAPARGETSAKPPALPVAPGPGDAAGEAAVETAVDEHAPHITEPPVAAPPVRPKRRRFAHPIGWTIGVVLLLSLFAGSLHFLAGRFGRFATVAAPEPAPVAPPIAPPVVAPALAADVLPYAVALEAHRDVATAFERVDALSMEHKDLSFYVAPLERDSVLHYHLMAGPVADSVAAFALRDTLIARRVKTSATPTDLRYTPLALLIGDYSARIHAEQQLAELRRLDIPAYLLVGVAADSAPLFRVFVGGFAGPAEADVVRQLLRAAGVRDNLVPRTRSSTR